LVVFDELTKKFLFLSSSHQAVHASVCTIPECVGERGG